MMWAAISSKELERPGINAQADNRVSHSWPSPSEGAAVVGVFRGFEEFLHEVEGVVQVEIVHVAAEEVQLVHEPGAELFPVALEIVPQVEVVVAPILDHVVIDGPGQIIIDLDRVPVFSDRPEGGVIGVEKFSRTALVAKHGQKLRKLSDRELRLSVDRPGRDALGSQPAEPGRLEEIFILIEVGTEDIPVIDPVRTEAPGAAEEIGMIDLLGGG